MSHPTPAATPQESRHTPRLCLAWLATAEPTASWFLVQTLHVYHPAIIAALDIVIIDPTPTGAHAVRLRDLAAVVPTLRIISQHNPHPLTLGDLIHGATTAEVICIGDGRTLLDVGALDQLSAWFAQHPDTADLHPVMPPDERREDTPAPALPGWATHHTQGNTSACPPAPGIVCAYRRAAWPTLRYQFARQEWGGNPFAAFSGIFCLNLDSATGRWRAAQGRFRQLGIAERVERFSAVPTPENHHRGCTLSWRRMIAEAARRDYAAVLIFEDDVCFLDDTVALMQTAAAELTQQTWDLCYLGAAVWGRQFPFIAGSSVLQECGRVTCTHALAIHARAYERLLRDIPEEGPAFDAWLDRWRAIDQYLSYQIDDGTYRALITAPRVATQPFLRLDPKADLALAARYTI